jgi:hypothetical protein
MVSLALNVTIHTLGPQPRWGPYLCRRVSLLCRCLRSQKRAVRRSEALTPSPGVIALGEG